MPARRRTAEPAASSSNSNPETSPQAEDPAYKMKRKKNNEAVQRTREKTKRSAEERKKRIDKLKLENVRLSQRIETEKSHISVLRDLIIQGKKNEEQDRIINEILNNSDDDDSDEDIINNTK